MAAKTTLYLVRHAKAADRDLWTGGDRDRPLLERGRSQAERLADALGPERPALVASSPWLRCLQTAEPIAGDAGLQVEPDDRLGYDAPDLAGFVAECVAAHAGRALVAVSHGDLIPHYLAQAGLLSGIPRLRTGSLFRLDLGQGGPERASLVDRGDLRG